MMTSQHLPLRFILIAFAVGIGSVAVQHFSSSDISTAVNVTVPDLSREALKGEVSFNDNCSKCHGPDGAGSDKGPPLIHRIYNPGHHGDPSFFYAAERGVKAHHWKFGDMPPLPKVTREEMANIIGYIRELQKANGIDYAPHRMGGYGY